MCVQIVFLLLPRLFISWFIVGDPVVLLNSPQGGNKEGHGHGGHGAKGHSEHPDAPPAQPRELSDAERAALLAPDIDDIDEETPRNSAVFDPNTGRVAADGRPPVYRDAVHGAEAGIQMKERTQQDGKKGQAAAVESLLDLQDDGESTSYNNLPNSAIQEDLNV